MQRLLFLSLIVLSLPSGAAKSYLRCSHIFSQQPMPRFSLDEINREMAPTLSKITTEVMANTILYTAQNKISYEGFSPNLANALRRTLEILLQAEKVQQLIELTYKNEALRRLGKEPLNRRDVFGMEIDFNHFGVQIPQEKIPLQEMDDSELARARWLASDAIKNLYIRQAQKEDLFFNIGLNRSVSKVLQFGHRRNYPISESYDLETREEGELIFAMFASFLRESLIREEVYRLIRARQIKWPKSRRTVNYYILVLSVYPELLPFLNRLPDLDFRYEIDFRSIDDIFSTSYAMLLGGSGIASLSLVKQIENVRGNYVEWLESYIEIKVIESDATNFNESADNLANLHRFLRKSWHKFLISKNLKENQMRMLIHGDDKNLTLRVESIDEDILEVEVLVRFYLMITRQDRRTDYR